MVYLRIIGTTEQIPVKTIFSNEEVLQLALNLAVSQSSTYQGDREFYGNRDRVFALRAVIAADYGLKGT